MIGAEYLRDLRRQGLKPKIVFVFDLGKIRNDGLYDPNAQLENGCHAEIHIEPNDSIAALDFRFLIGCVVSINVLDAERGRQLYKYIRAQHPASITISDGKTFTHHEVFTNE